MAARRWAVPFIKDQHLSSVISLVGLLFSPRGWNRQPFSIVPLPGCANFRMMASYQQSFLIQN